MLRAALRTLHQVKANFTPARISAMEDFISRGDRRISKVIRRAWELGATNDGWWQSEDKNYKIWSQAIKDAGMEWKYRQVGMGEWDVMERAGDARFRGQGGGGKGRVDRGELADARLDSPLPWDHINTGISKWWLKTDLQRALEAATVPDCSHSGLCSECGVCGDDFGDNVVFEPPEIPEFKGHISPRSNKAQRLHFRFSKRGDSCFVGHLDLMSTWDRICRRAGLPVSEDPSPYVVRRRMYSALPLPLAATGDDEVLELYLTRRMDPEEVLSKLREQLPMGLSLSSVREMETYKADGSNGEKMSQLLTSVEYFVSVALDGVDDAAHRDQILASSIKDLLLSATCIVERPHKKKQGKTQKIDVRSGIVAAEIPRDHESLEIIKSLPLRPNTSVIRFVSSIANGNPAISPEIFVQALSSQSSNADTMSVVHIHRSKINFREPTPPKPSMDRLKSLVRMEGHLAAAKVFSNSGPWAGGLENRVDLE